MRPAVCLLMLAFFGLTGCGTKPTVTAHGQPVSYWVERIQDPDEKTRLRAVKALGNVGAKDPVVVPTLITAIKDKKEQIRVEAILALLRMGSDARDAIPALTEARQDSSPNVRDCAAKALEKIQGP